MNITVIPIFDKDMDDIGTSLLLVGMYIDSILFVSSFNK